MPDTATVDRGSEDAVAVEAALRVKARKDASLRSFDPRLGATREEAQARIAEIRADLGAYGEYVHGHVPARHHKLWIALIQALISGTLTETAIGLGLLPESERGTRRNKLLLLAPPASAKSSWCSIALPTWYLGNNPSHNVLFFTSSDPAAVGFANTIKILLEYSKEHREIFPEIEGRPHKARGWSGDGLYLRATPMSGQSPAYRAVGWGASVMGQRADLLCIDDPMNQEDAMSEVEQGKAKRYFDMTLGPRLKPDQGAVLAVMTRWAEGDLASHFIEKAEQAGDFLIVALPMIAEPTAEQPDPLGRAAGEVLWPEQFSEKFVAQTRRGMLAAHFACVTGDMRVELVSDPLRVYARPYQGDVVVLRTARGHDLTCTPNHPIVTRLGTVAAGTLEVGDEVFSRAVQLGAASGDDHDDDIPPPIEQVWEFLPKVLRTAALDLPLAESARTTMHDFHGDAVADGEVDVVRTNRLLWDIAERRALQQDGERTIGGGLVRAGPLEGDGPSLLHERRLRDAPAFGSIAAQVAGAVVGDALELPLAVAAGPHPLPAEVVEHERAVAPIPPGDGVAGFAVQVATDQIVHVDRVPFLGHVYNLQTHSNTYLSNGVLVGNCVYQCSAAQMAGDVFQDERWIKPLPRDFRTPGPDGTSLRDRLRVFQGVDVAFSEKDRACYTVILTLGQDVASGDLFVLDVLRERMTEVGVEDALVDQILAWHPAAIGVEDSAFRHAITVQIVQGVMRRIACNIQIVSPKGMLRGASDKVARARVPARVAQLGQLYADKQASWWPAFIGELLAFPRGKNQDQVDALSLAVYMPSTLVARSRRPTPVSFNPD